VRRTFLLLAVMGSMLALGATSLTVAQPQEVTATGVIEPAPPYAPDPTPTCVITDEATSARYDLQRFAVILTHALSGRCIDAYL
jgi:hypothetical protein